jgi:hypothetical protein
MICSELIAELNKHIEKHGDNKVELIYFNVDDAEEYEVVSDIGRIGVSKYTDPDTSIEVTTCILATEDIE